MYARINFGLKRNHFIFRLDQTNVYTFGLSERWSDSV